MSYIWTISLFFLKERGMLYYYSFYYFMPECIVFGVHCIMSKSESKVSRPQWLLPCYNYYMVAAVKKL